MRIRKEIKEKFYGIYNVLSFFKMYKLPISEIINDRKKIKLLEKKYEGKRCFIIGNGPSLTPGDLQMLRNEFCFAANRIYEMYEKTEWRPTFYTIQDIYVADEFENSIINAMEESEISFIRQTLDKKLNPLKKDCVIGIPIWSRLRKDGSRPFSNNLQKFAFDGATVTYLSMQLASYLGFKEIYLLGVDHSFPYEIDENGEIKLVDNTISAHFFETENDKISTHMRANNRIKVTRAYESAEKASKTGGFRIYNATRGGKLEVFERVVLEEILKREHE